MPMWTPLALLALTLVLIAVHFASPRARAWVWKVLAAKAVLMLGFGLYLALVWAPPEREMGDVYRIIYMHVPEVWMALLAFSLNFFASMAYLFKKSWVLDSLAEAGAEVGLLFGATGVLLGSIWGRPTWGVWWDWDPRLTTAAIMLVLYTGYLALRKFVDDPDKRATWSAVVGIFAFVDLPIVWFSVRWWRSLHQVQSTPQTVDPSMTMVLRWFATAFLCLLFVFIWHRYQIARRARETEVALPPALEVA
jgi:heme exporter protein C